MSKGTWTKFPDHKDENARPFYYYDDPELENMCGLKKDMDDGKWYYDTDQNIGHWVWKPLDVSNAREAKKVVEVMARMEGRDGRY